MCSSNEEGFFVVVVCFFTAFLFWRRRRLFKNASHGEKQQEVRGGETVMIARRESLGCSPVLQTCINSDCDSSVHFVHVEHAKDTSDLFNSDVLESICKQITSSVCTFVYVALISLCAGVTVICRLWRWMMICFPHPQQTTNSLVYL